MGTGHSSVLDLAFTDMRDNVKWMCKKMFVGGSHHCPVMVEVDNITKQPRYFVSKNLLYKNLGKVSGVSSIGDLTDALTVARQSATIDLNKFKHSPKSWWDDSLAKKYRLLNAARCKARKTERFEDIEVACQLLVEWKAAVKEAKKLTSLRQLRI